MEKVKKDNRGGARAGAGRPKGDPSAFSEQFKKKAMRALSKMAVQYGIEDPFLALADLALSPDVQDTVRLGAWKIYSEMNVIRESKQSVEVSRGNKPQVYLPEVLAKPPEAVKREEDARRLH
jgi:hypothetical protein